jgi:DNA-binding NarL/FixJ family response regulator
MQPVRVVMQPVRVVLAEDDYLARSGLVALLATVPEVSVVAECAELDELLAAVPATAPDVVLTDIRMPPTRTDEGIRAAGILRETHPDVGVVVVSHYVDPEYALALVEQGSHRRGYLLKDRLGDVTQLVAAIRTVAAGGSPIDPLVVDALMGRGAGARAGGGAGAIGPLARLTEREREVLGLVARGASNAAIAVELRVGERAVEKHINSIFGKLDLPVGPDVNRRVAAVLLYLSRLGGGDGSSAVHRPS